MSEVIEVPQYLLAKSGEQISHKFLDWINSTKKKLLKAFPPGERAFCRILTKMTSRLPSGWKTTLWYTRQKHFVVSDGVVFFGDFYFRNSRFLVEIDGESHSGAKALEKDAWRSKLISAHRNTAVLRFHNDQVIHGDFRDVELTLIEGMTKHINNARGRRLLTDYRKMRFEFSHIYDKAEPLTTKRNE